ncbi:MAG TPA: septum formation initiator family protein [Candidatus Latescibacteria bacterium]|nr:septum formation initiator family protein [Candidatus Latescibacterota bacterium]
MAGSRKFRRFLVLALALFGLYFVFGEHGLWRIWKLKRRARALKEEVVRIEAKRRALEEEKKKLEEGDPEYIEKLARERYGMVKPGERVYIVLPPPEGAK